MIQFNPELPEWKKEAYHGLQMGHFQKIIVPLKKNAFDVIEHDSWVLYQAPTEAKEKQYANKHHLTVKKQQVMAFLFKPKNLPLVIGFFGGDRAKLFEQECQNQVWGASKAQPCDALAIDTTKQALSDIYGKKELSDIIDFNEIQVTHWSLEPFTLGAYSYSGPGNWVLHQQLSQPISVDNHGKQVMRLFFAGEACAQPMFNGSLAGAYETGLQAARDINNALGHK